MKGVNGFWLVYAFLNLSNMGVEIERKFLVNKALWEKAPKGKTTAIKQGYLSVDPAATVRVRLKGEKAFLTIKGKNKGATRAEFEYEIPVTDAEEMLQTLAKNCIEKTRTIVELEGKTWEVDEFSGENEGLLMAELELETEAETFTKPDWIEKEVTDDNRYYNSSLVQNPFKNWGQQ